MNDSPQITPTVGRKVWFFKTANQAEPWDATVIAINSDEGPQSEVTLYVISPIGRTGTIRCRASDGPVDGPHYRWMPYQKGQAAKDATTPFTQRARQPVEGEAVLFWPSAGYEGSYPIKATITKVWSDTCVNLSMPTDDSWECVTKRVPVVRNLDVNRPSGYYCMYADEVSVPAADTYAEPVLAAPADIEPKAKSSKKGGAQ